MPPSSFLQYLSIVLIRNLSMSCGGCHLKIFIYGERENMANFGMKRINYKIHKCSGYLSNYAPENIMVDDPSDQSSRWSTNTNTPPQYLTVKLDTPAVVKYITFGKYNKSHVCNLKKFCVVGGMQDGIFTELLSGGLENNNVKERFALKWTRRGVPFPVQYISIIPQQAWGPSFNFCLWFLQLEGLDRADIVRGTMYNYNLRAEEEIIRICLKHLRQQCYTEAYKALEHETGVVLEAPQLSRLYTTLVEEGNFHKAEAIMEDAAKDGVFDWYVSRQPYTAQWTNITPCSPELAERLSDSDSPNTACAGRTIFFDTLQALNGAVSACSNEMEKTECNSVVSSGGVHPGQRGGHQMCIDPETGTIYLYGGWDGEADLSDLWAYSVQNQRWTLICRESERFKGPSPRSCHKMVLDTGRRQLFILGRYLDNKHRSADNIKSDFYVFDISEECWWPVCEDTGARGGPKLLFDHQMSVDSQRHIIYVFGGKILTLYNETEDSHQYSGLYSYHIAEDRWTLLLPDSPCVPPEPNTILSRASHSMLFHSDTRTIYVFGGQRNKQDLTDMLAICVGMEDGEHSHQHQHNITVKTICKGPPGRSPPPGYTQRATLDPTLNEIYVLAGLSKEKEKRATNSLWVFSLNRLEWSCIYKNIQQAGGSEGKSSNSNKCVVEPCPRYAHQLVYDSVRRKHYLFGGNPGRAAHLRLDDFWSLQLSRLSSENAWMEVKLCIRKLQYWEMVRGGNATEALSFLQGPLHQAIDHSSPHQAREFQLMATMLFSEQNQALFFHPPLDPIEMKQRHPHNPNMKENLYDGCDSSEDEEEAWSQSIVKMETDESNQSLSSNVETDKRKSLKTKNVESFVISDNKVRGKCDKLEVHYKRCQLFQQLSEYFPQNLVQPKNNLTDFITL